MSKQDIVNKRLNCSKECIKQINLVNGNNDELSGILELAFAGMLAHYGEEALKNIYIAFLTTKFVVDKEPIEDLLNRKFKFSLEDVDLILGHAPGTFYDVTGYEYIDKFHRRKYKFDRKIYVQNDGSFDKATLLRSIIHQLNHVMNSLYNPVVSVYGKLAARMGISLDKFVSRETSHIMVEESINFLQTDEIVGEIYDFLLVNIDNPDIKRNLEDVARCPRKEIVDDELTGIIRKLYEDEFFKNILVDRRFDGRLNSIRQSFDSCHSMGSYSRFLAACEVVATSKSSGAKEQAKIMANQLVKRYLDAPKRNSSFE